jgi:hypothetical protein
MSENSGNSGCVWTVVAVIGIALLVGQCRSCSNKKKTVQKEKVQAAQMVIETKQQQSFNEELVAFLAEYDPPLSAKRAETIQAIGDNQEIRYKLRTKIDKYPSEEAKAIFRTKAERYEKMIQQLNQLLAAIDKNATIAMAQREASVDEGGGMQSADSQTLIDSAAIILKQAASLQNDLESFSNDKPLLDKNTKPVGTLKDEVLNKSDSDANPSSLLGAPEDPKMKALSDKADELEKMADKAAKALETIRKNEAAPAQTPKPPADQKTAPAVPKPKPAMDREAVQKEIRRLDASIANNEANLNQAWARINQITRNGTVPIEKGSRQHVEYLNAHRVLQDCEAQLPELKSRRDFLKGKLEGL